MPHLNTLYCCRSFGWCVVADTIMELFKCLFGVAVLGILVCNVTAGRQWAPGLEKPQLQHPPQQSNVSPPADSFDKCQVEEGQKIRCGTRDVTAEQCGAINCCFDGSQCYYGKAGRWAMASLCFRGRSCTVNINLPGFRLVQWLCSVPVTASLWWLWLGMLPGHTWTWIQSACLKQITPPALLLTSPLCLPSSSSQWLHVAQQWMRWVEPSKWLLFAFSV